VSNAKHKKEFNEAGSISSVRFSQCSTIVRH